MCGIISIVSFNNHERHLPLLADMAAMMTHRGPDDEGFALFSETSNGYEIFYGKDTPQNVIAGDLIYSPKNTYKYSDDKTVAFAQRRLSIIDLTASGHQPMSDETGRYWITYNGEIYNYKEIREELVLRGYKFSSTADTEVIIKAYMAWGKECQNKFNGMWAFVIWDNREKTLWISRDRFGIKPLYYYFHEDFFIIASEIKCILPIADLTPNIKEIYAYLLDGPSDAHEETFFSKVFRFPAGHSAEYSLKEKRRKLNFEKYWDLGPPCDEYSFSRQKLIDYVDQFYWLLEDSVKLRLYADVNVSCALSGGLDSSTITYLAQNLLKKNGGSVEKLKTISTIYHDKDIIAFDEEKLIDTVSNELNLKGYKMQPDFTKLIEKNDLGLWCYENCFDDMPISTMNTFEICKLNNIKVNLDGQGADEGLAGYTRFWGNFFAKNPRNIEYFLSFFNVKIGFKDKIRYFLGLKAAPPQSPFEEIITKKIDLDFRTRRVFNLNDTRIVSINDALQGSIRFNLKKLLKNLDFISMASSIESRQPFMDFRIISFLNSVPASYKMRNGYTKFLLRKALNDKLPSEIVWRKDKYGWPQPTDYWLKNYISEDIQKVIQKSKFLADMLEIPKGEIINYLGFSSRNCLRLYNLARHFDIFFNKEYKKISNN